MSEHRYTVRVTWTGNRGAGTTDYRAYDRAHVIETAGKPPIPGSADPAFRGDPDRWNPEELFVASLSACHKLWYLHLCATAGVVVVAYADKATGVMTENSDGSGQFTQVVLRPQVTVAQGSDVALAERLHTDAHRMCFIARSVNMPVRIEPVIGTASD